MVPTIRPYRSEDAAGCRACVVELQDAERQVDPRLRPGAAIADAYLDQIHKYRRDYAGDLFVVECDGEIAGLVNVLTRVPFEAIDEPPGNYAIVAELVVLERFRRRGIARALLDVAEQRARSAGASELQIAVLSRNAVARDLYLREGFVPYKETLSKRLDG